MPIIASSKLERKRSSLSRAVASARVLALAHALVEAPGHDRGEPRGGHERGVDPRPLPRVGDRVGVVEDLVAAERGADAVVEHDVERREQERDPVLVERRGRRSSRRSGSAPRCSRPRRGRRAPTTSAGRWRRSPSAACGPCAYWASTAATATGTASSSECQTRIAEQQAEREQPRGVGPQQREHPAVALLPVLVRERPALGQEVAQASHRGLIGRCSTEVQSACAAAAPTPLPLAPSAPSAISVIGV